jgi:4'-phosphopantetheinyl transferase
MAFLRAILPAHVMEKAEDFLRRQDADAYLLGRFLLAHGLTSLGFSPALLNEIRYSSLGRPYFSPKLDFNIAHAGDYVVCASSTSGSVGIDLERIHDLDLQGFEDQFSVREWNSIQESLSPLKTFFRLWTMKEAVVKADGAGLQASLNALAVESSPVLWNGRSWHVREVTIDPAYWCHVATDRDEAVDLVPERVVCPE